jgi:cation transport ATPase
MKDFNFTELFCEILSGLIAVIVFVLILDVAGYCDIEKYFCSLKIDLSFLTILLVVSYFVGLLIDAIGLSLGEWFLDNLVSKKAPQREKFRNFYKNANESLVKYRDTQWTYYSLYRNLLVLFFIGLPFYGIKIWKCIDWKFSVVSMLLIIGIMVALFASMKTLLKLYYEITEDSNS